MIYIINDVVEDIFSFKKTITIDVCHSEEDVLLFLAQPENLKKIKGELKIEKVVL